MRKGNAERRPIGEAGPSQAGRHARILIADDDLGTRELLTAFTQDLGYAAVAVSDGKAALAAAATDRPDLILLDVSMPGLSGFEVCRRLKADQATQPIPVLLITGMEAEHRRAGFEAGADDFLRKPFNSGELRARIDTLLSRRWPSEADRQER